MDKTAISFGFSKTTEKKNIKKSELVDSVEQSEETDFVSAVESQQVKSLKPKEEKKEIIIPPIKTNNWKTVYGTEKCLKASSEPGDTIESQAVKELVHDAAKQLDNWDSRGSVDPNLEIPLLMQNRVPAGYETDDQLDVSLRPDEPEEAHYDDVPIEAFGLAMLKGMGWKPGQGIGKNTKAVAPVEAVLRPKGMGLGADRRQAQELNAAKQGDNSEDKSGELRMKKGAYCLIEKGPHKDLYATIEGIDEDNIRLMLKLTVSGELVTVSQYNTKLVTEDEYKKYSKYINKGAADRYKDKEERKKNKEDRKKNKGDSEEGRHKEERVSHDRHTQKHEREKDRHKDKDRSDKRRKCEEERPKSSSSASAYTNGTGSSALWVRPKLRVRLIDEHYKKGKYYKDKVVVVDVFDKDHCVCKTDNGNVLEDVSQSMLETVVPKTDSSHVCIVAGKHRGQLGQVLERDRKQCKAMIQLLSDRDRVIPLDYDYICEYVGDISEEFDY